MKKLILLLVITINVLLINTTYAASNPNSDYTYIDCRDGSDLTGEAFNSGKPYLTLKAGVENTINYINTNGLTNTTGIGADYTSKNFNIFVRPGCLFNGKSGAQIEVNFYGSTNNSTLTIAGLGGLFIMDNIFFNLSGPTVGNVTFRNINFWKNNIYGFFLSKQNGVITYYLTNGSPITVKDSIINLSQNNLEKIDGCQNYHYMHGCTVNGDQRFGGIKLENNKIDITVSADYVWKAPLYGKNNKISFSNTGTQKYNVYFYTMGRNGEGYNYETLNMFSNEINLNGNNFFTDNTNATYINNKFLNVGVFTAGTDTTNFKLNNFINNQIEATNEVDISTNGSAFNNHFVNGFKDTVDKDNTKRNFKNLSGSEKGVGWIFKKDISNTITINEDYKSLYKDITGNTLEEPENPVHYLIY